MNSANGPIPPDPTQHRRGRSKVFSSLTCLNVASLERRLEGNDGFVQSADKVLGNLGPAVVLLHQNSRGSANSLPLFRITQYRNYRVSKISGGICQQNVV